MSSSEEITTAQTMPEGSGDADTLDLLTEALVSYLEEIDDYRSICLRHERATSVYSTPSALHIAQFFPWKEATVTHLRAAAERLPRWNESPFWRTEQSSWMTLFRNIGKRPTPGEKQSLLVRGIAWQGRPVLVCASSVQEMGYLGVELLLPPIQADLPELPLRVVASGLLCLDSLLSNRVATSIPRATVAQPRFLSIPEFLLRAMPQNLYASQCFSLRGAEK